MDEQKRCELYTFRAQVWNPVSSDERAAGD